MGGDIIAELIEARSGGNPKHAASINSTITLNWLPRRLRTKEKSGILNGEAGEKHPKLAKPASASQTTSRSRL
jgi:hypothetical protein